MYAMFKALLDLYEACRLTWLNKRPALIFGLPNRYPSTIFSG